MTAPQQIHCKQCGTGNPASATVCFQCGGSLAARPSADIAFPGSTTNTIQPRQLTNQTNQPFSSGAPNTPGNPFLQGQGQRQQPQQQKSYDPNLWWQALLLGGGLWATTLLYCLLRNWGAAVICVVLAVPVTAYGVYAKLNYKD